MLQDRDHKLFVDLAGAEILELRFEKGTGGRDHVVELTVRGATGPRRFRFRGVPALRLGDRFPDVGWFQVRDVSARQLDALRVHVTDGEQSAAIEFWASDVTEVDNPAG